MSKRIDELLAAEGAAAEAFEEDQSTPYPENVKISRGNPRSKVLQVRLNPDEFAAIERIADKRKLPASTVARELLLKLIAEEDSGGGEVTPAAGLIAALTNVEALSSRVREQLAESVLFSEEELGRAIHAFPSLTASMTASMTAAGLARVAACKDEVPSGRLIGEDAGNPGRGE
jgi:hypothetical protein